jgi:hypothetical protein
MTTHGCVKYALAFATSELDGVESSVLYPGSVPLRERAPRIHCIELGGTLSRYEHDTEAHIYLNLYNYSNGRQSIRYRTCNVRTKRSLSNKSFEAVKLSSSTVHRSQVLTSGT